MNHLPVSIGDVERAAGVLAGFARRTPLIPLDRPGEVWAKPENLQRTGSFKFRGAFNRLSAFTTEQRRRGVVTDSSGNHAQGVACAAQLLSIPATIVIPVGAPEVKVQGTLSYGATVVRCGPSSDERQAMARELEIRDGLTYAPPFDDPLIIAGQGTVGLELVQDLRVIGLEPSLVVVPVGGGGLSSGVVTAVKALCPAATVVGVEPELAADGAQSLREGRRVAWSASDCARTMADGVRTQRIGELNFAILSALMDGIVTVSEDAIAAATVWLATRSKLVVEPTGALPLAALLAGRLPVTRGPVVLVLSGGNIDPSALAALLTLH